MGWVGGMPLFGQTVGAGEAGGHGGAVGLAGARKPVLA